jgi:hypothetical protein
MCDVCAVFGVGEHWSDAGLKVHAIFPVEDIRHYRTERRFRVALINRLVEPHGLTCGDWDGDAFVLTDRRGRSKVVPHLGDVWAAAERLSGRALDPLGLADHPRPA